MSSESSHWLQLKLFHAFKKKKKSVMDLKYISIELYWNYNIISFFVSKTTDASIVFPLPHLCLKINTQLLLSTPYHQGISFKDTFTSRSTQCTVTGTQCKHKRKLKGWKVLSFNTLIILLMSQNARGVTRIRMWGCHLCVQPQTARTSFSFSSCWCSYSVVLSTHDWKYKRDFGLPLSQLC